MENQQVQMNEVITPIVDTPEVKTKKFGSIVMIIMAILMLGGVGFGVYGMFFQEKEECPKCEECEKCEECKCESGAVKKTYEEYANEILSSGTSRRVASERMPSKSSTEQGFTGIIGNDNKLVISRIEYENNGTSMVLQQGENISKQVDENVVNVFYMNVGNGFGPVIIYTKADGGVYGVNFNNFITGEGEKVIKDPVKIDNISNVVNVFARGGSGGYNAVAVDIDGKITEIPFTELMK